MSNWIVTYINKNGIECVGKVYCKRDDIQKKLKGCTIIKYYEMRSERGH